MNKDKEEVNEVEIISDEESKVNILN